MISQALLHLFDHVKFRDGLRRQLDARKGTILSVSGSGAASGSTQSATQSRGGKAVRVRPCITPSALWSLGLGFLMLLCTLGPWGQDGNGDVTQ